MLVITNCLTTPETSSSIATTTETSADSEIVHDKSNEEKTKTSASTETDVAGESSKSKRTVEGSLGYGFNQPNSQNKFRTYPYQQLRHYSTVRTAAEHLDSRQRQYQHQQAVAGQRPQGTAPSSSVGSHSSLQNYPTGKHADTQEHVYFARPSYQQVSAYRGFPAVSGHSSGNGAHVFPSSGSPHASSFVSGPPQNAPVFFTGHSLASQHNPFTAVTSHNVLNPFLAAGNFRGHSLLYQHPGSSAVAFLQNPSGHIGPQILPVIILRVNNDANGNSVFHHGGISPAFLQAGLHGLNLQTLLYPAQHFRAPQQAVYPRFEDTQPEQPPQLLYQEGFTSGEIQKPEYAQPPAATVPQKVSYAHQKKPLIPTVAPDLSHQQQKLGKNAIVSDRDENGYSQYKYVHKDKV